MTKPNSPDFDKQFEKPVERFYQELDFVNWFRFYFLIKTVLKLKSCSVLEIGVGSGILRDCIKPVVQSYETFDINPNLSPDYIGDIREINTNLANRYDCIIIADVLEHIPFEDQPDVLKVLATYLKEDGYLLVTIPHRRSNFLFMSPHYIPRVFTVPTGFLSVGGFYRRFIKRKIWIDPDHCWEIGDGRIRRKDVESVFSQQGFKKVSFKKLIYVDYWVLKK